MMVFMQLEIAINVVLGSWHTLNKDHTGIQRILHAGKCLFALVHFI